MQFFQYFAFTTTISFAWFFCDKPVYHGVSKYFDNSLNPSIKNGKLLVLDPAFTRTDP